MNYETYVALASCSSQNAVEQKYSYWDSWYKELIISYVILNMYIKAPKQESHVQE
jgi:hypothetical protein